MLVVCFVLLGQHCTLIENQALISKPYSTLKALPHGVLRSRFLNIFMYPTHLENKKWYYLSFRSSEILDFLNFSECQGHQVSVGSQHIDASDICCHSHVTVSLFPWIWEPKLVTIYRLRMMGSRARAHECLLILYKKLTHQGGTELRRTMSNIQFYFPKQQITNVRDPQECD